jgi:hypothetical protein
LPFLPSLFNRISTLFKLKTKFVIIFKRYMVQSIDVIRTQNFYSVL